MKTEYVNISDFGTVITGKTPATANEVLWNGEIPFITPSDIVGYDMHYIFETERTISETGANAQKKTVIPQNTICVSCIASIGKMCLTSAEQSVTNQQINSIVVDNKYDYQYLFYLLRYFLPYLQLIGGGTGSGTPIISKSKFEKLKYPVCKDKDIQSKISNVLLKYDSLIELNNKRIKLLEQMAENLYKEWFVRFRFPGHETAEFENGIPKGWEYKTVEEVSSVLRRGISPDYDDEGDYTVISQKCIRQTIMNIAESRKQTKAFAEELNLQDSDTVICSTGTGTLGRVGQVFGSYPNTTFDSHVTLVRAKDGIGKQFLFWTLKDLQTWFMNMGIGSTNQQELYRSTIKGVMILLPVSSIVDEFEMQIQPIHDEMQLLVMNNGNLIKQRDLLLPRLMSGKLEV